MTGFSIKIPDELSIALEEHLKATGRTRSAFVRELIERELDGEKKKRDALRARVMDLAGVLGRDAPQGPRTNRSHETNETLLEDGYGLDNARLRYR